jgi:hypothetical protein
MANPTLNYQWITEHPLDAEYKRYVLLSYVQNIRKKFSETELFPHLSDIITHLQNLESIGNGFHALEEDFPRELVGFDQKTLSPVYKKIGAEDSVFSFIRELIQFAKPKFSDTLALGKEVFDEVEQNLRMETIGLLPMLKDEGYLLLGLDGSSQIDIYRFSVSSISVSSENYRSMSMEWVMSDSLSLSNSPQQIKLNLVRNFPDLPNPAAFVCISLRPYPLKETLLPVTRRILLRTLASVA